MIIHPTQSDHMIDDTNQNFTISPREQITAPIIMDKRQITPEKQVIDLNVVLFFVKHDLKGVLKCIRVKICTHYPPPPPPTDVAMETSQT